MLLGTSHWFATFRAIIARSPIAQGPGREFDIGPSVDAVVQTPWVGVLFLVTVVNYPIFPPATLGTARYAMIRCGQRLVG